ncbi:M42 family peptidase [bacterium]|nr:M42 family peptidase [bacterium]
MVLKTLSDLNGVSGFEEDIRAYIKEQIASKVDEIKVDSIGNLYAFKRGKNCSKKVLWLAHMDEVGFMVRNIQKNGMIQFSAIGGVDPSILASKRVVILGKEKIEGVIGYKPIHLQRNDFDQPVTKEKLYIDIGANSPEEVKGKIELGDPIAFRTDCEVTDTFIRGKAIDDRVGCALLIKLIEDIEPPDFDTWYVFATQEEVGLRGSKVAAYRIQPDLAMILEGTTASDLPCLDRKRYTTRVNEGPVIVVTHQGLVIQQNVIQFLESTAKSKNIPYQIKERIAGGTDAISFAKQAFGAYVGIIALPTRYIHSPISFISKKDYENSQHLVKAIHQELPVFFKDYDLRRQS